uniref:hypothetical protein n=1 Tax=Clostridium sp. NkU-1 TaxID=1095009 RepID=UPI000B2B1C7A
MVEKKTLGSFLVKALFVVILVILALSCILPLLYTLALSFSSKSAAEAGLVGFVPVDFTTYAYDEIMKDKNFFSLILGIDSKSRIGAYYIVECAYISIISTCKVKERICA